MKTQTGMRHEECAVAQLSVRHVESRQVNNRDDPLLRQLHVSLLAPFPATVNAGIVVLVPDQGAVRIVRVLTLKGVALYE